MSKKSQHIALMEKLLMHLKNAKLEYLKASDHVNYSEEKRFFNQQALIRNRFFQDVLSEIQALGVTFDDLIISRFNFDQLLVSTIDTSQSNSLSKSVWRLTEALLGKLYQRTLLIRKNIKTPNVWHMHLFKHQSGYHDQSQVLVAAAIPSQKRNQL